MCAVRVRNDLEPSWLLALPPGMRLRLYVYVQSHREPNEHFAWPWIVVLAKCVRRSLTIMTYWFLFSSSSSGSRTLVGVVPCAGDWLCGGARALCRRAHCPPLQRMHVLYASLTKHHLIGVQQLCPCCFSLMRNDYPLQRMHALYAYFCFCFYSIVLDRLLLIQLLRMHFHMRCLLVTKHSLSSLFLYPNHFNHLHSIIR